MYLNIVTHFRVEGVLSRFFLRLQILVTQRTKLILFFSDLTSSVRESASAPIQASRDP